VGFNRCCCAPETELSPRVPAAAPSKWSAAVVDSSGLPTNPRPCDSVHACLRNGAATRNPLAHNRQQALLCVWTN
jgi:hypothetical protein